MQVSQPMGPASSAPTPHIEVHGLELYYGSVPAVRGVSFNVLPGEQLTLLGPSGCGKSTTLRAIAGLEKPTSGEIRIDGVPMYSSAHQINIPAEKRRLSMVFQSYAIWPHMTVFDNVAYGLRVRRAGAPEIKEKVGHALSLVQMSEFAGRRASQLSGGQQQRVALARAFVFSPSVLLFDEPLSNLDAKLRADMRIELRDLQHRLGITSVYVTHDLEEALAMSDRIAVMRDGVIEQTGTPDEIYRLPRSAFVADFVGSANLIRGRLRHGSRRKRPHSAGDIGRTRRLLYGVWTTRRRRTCRLCTHRAPHYLFGSSGRDTKCLVSANWKNCLSRRLHPGSRRLGRSTSHRALRRYGADCCGSGSLHYSRSQTGRAAGRVSSRPLFDFSRTRPTRGRCCRISKAMSALPLKADISVAVNNAR